MVFWKSLSCNSLFIQQCSRCLLESIPLTNVSRWVLPSNGFVQHAIKSSYWINALETYRNDTRWQSGPTTEPFATIYVWSWLLSREHETCSMTTPTRKLTKLPNLDESCLMNRSRSYLVRILNILQTLTKPWMYIACRFPQTALFRANQFPRKEHPKLSNQSAWYA